MTAAIETRTAVPARHRIAAVLLFLTAVGVVVGSVIALDALQTYQLVLNVVGALALAYVGMLLLRGDGRARPLAIALTWLAALGVTAESGGHQARMNDTGALGSQNTEYFLPPAVWIVIAVLFLVAVATMALTKKVRGS